MLKIDSISAGYGSLKVLFDVSLTVGDGEVVSLVGSNGAGKTTLLRVLSGLTPVTSGMMMFDGQDLVCKKSHERVDLGIAHIPQGRGILSTLTVRDNLIMGAYSKRMRAKATENIEKAYNMFKILGERRNQPAGNLSGGEQQMLAIARALMMEPKLLMLDEPSLGLAPIVVDEMFEIIANVAQSGMSILVVEQNLVKALSVASRGYVMEIGQIVMEGSADELINDEKVKTAYLGI